MDPTWWRTTMPSDHVWWSHTLDRCEDPHQQKNKEFVKGLERTWVRHFGTAKYLRVDAAIKGWESRAVRDWCSDHGVILEIAPGHNWLGVVERRHQVVRRALELYMTDAGGSNLSNLKEAATYVPQMSFTKGSHRHSGSWDGHIGKRFRWCLSSTAMALTASRPSASLQEFNRNVCKLASPFWRPTLMPNYAVTWTRSATRTRNQVLVGQRCWYWRVQGSGRLQKSKWRGPARCVGVELSNGGGKTAVQWLVHGTSVLRCSPAHVRPMVEDTRSSCPVNWWCS